ncbi:hypothetical protein F4X73_10310 [Candidatus Poribacteria bacterium]|nr:hypothetical protein [Candidatus Poribacteria bacterium]MYF57093.1 hypothetical protein [Candidatus Poribacteria bacterium]
MKKEKSLSLLTTYLTSFILIVGVIGCTEVPYTGPVITVDFVDNFLDRTGEDVVCLHDGFDTVCVKRVESDEDDSSDLAILNIYPEDLTYLFYYNEKLILEAKRTLDTSDLVQELIDSDELDMPTNNTAEPSENIVNITEGWTIQIYYHESFPEADRGETPETSGFNIKVAEGQKINSIRQKDELTIKYPLQRDKPDGNRVFEFSIETESPIITIEVDGLISEHIAIFYIDVEGGASDEGISRLQLEPK